jgi:hypothetical protein
LDYLPQKSSDTGDASAAVLQNLQGHQGKTRKVTKGILLLHDNASVCKSQKVVVSIMD